VDRADERNGWTPLYQCTMENNIEAVKFLVGAGANIDKGDMCGWTPLYRGTEENNIGVVKILI